MDFLSVTRLHTWDAPNSPRPTNAPLSTKSRAFVYWMLVLVARVVSEASFLPDAFRRSAVMKLTNAASSWMGHMTYVDECVVCQNMERAVEMDDAEEVRNLIDQYPSAVGFRWFGLIPVERAIFNCCLQSADVLLPVSCLSPTDLLVRCRNLTAFEWLLGKGANPTKLDKENRRCVDAMALSGCIDVAEAMIQEGGRPSDYCLQLLRRRGMDDVAARIAKALAASMNEHRILASLVLLRACGAVYAAQPARERILQFVD